MKIKRLLLAASAIASVALLTSNAVAQTVTDDPLHGYARINGQNVNTDTGAVSPINLLGGGASGFGFFASPAPLTDDLNIIVLEPNTISVTNPVSITGNVGGGTLFTHVGTFSSGDLATLLGFAGSSPANPFNGFVEGDTAAPGSITSFNVFRADLGTQTEQSLNLSTMVDNIVGGVAAGTEITAFSVESSGTVATALSGVLMQTSSVPGPIVGAGLPGLIAACGGLLALGRRRRKLVA